jgi:polysaccharide pyruvyl transferase WcaK-like protein
MKKILIVNRGYCDNLGDQALNIAMGSLIKNNLNCEVIFSEFITLASEPKKINLNHRSVLIIGYVRKFIKALVPVKFVWLIRNVLRINKTVGSKGDVIVIGGGQLIQSTNTFDIAAATWVFFARFYNKRVIFCGVGAGIKFTYLNRLFYSYALKKCNAICVRDLESSKTIKDCFGVSSFIAGDAVFTEELFTPVSKVGFLLGIPCIAVYNKENASVQRNDYYEIWLNFLKQKKIDVKKCALFYTTENDYLETVSFSNYLKQKYDISLMILESNSLPNLRKILSTSQIVISGRMHALILAANYSCEIVVFPINKKLIDFESLLKGFDEDGFVEYKAMTSKKLIEFLKSWIDDV